MPKSFGIAALTHEAAFRHQGHDMMRRCLISRKRKWASSMMTWRHRLRSIALRAISIVKSDMIMSRGVAACYSSPLK